MPGSRSFDETEDTPILSHSTNQGLGEASSESEEILSMKRNTLWYGGVKCWPKCCSVEVVLVLYSLYFAAAWPLSEQFIYAEVSKEKNFTEEIKDSINCSHSNSSSAAFQLQKDVQSVSTSYMIYQNVAQLLPAFFVTVFLGGYSDKAGRKLAMIYPCIGAVLRCIFCVFIIQLNLSLTWFFVASVIEGCFGATAMILMATFSYISDITTEESRSFRIILLESCLGVGIATSQLALGYIIQGLGYMWPFVIIGSLAFIDIIYIAFCVPETIVPLRKVTLMTTEHIKGTFRLYLTDDGSARRWKLCVTLTIVLMCGLPELGGADSKTYHMLDSPLCWDSVLLGQFGAVNYVVLRLGGLFAAKFFEAHIKDVGLLILGCASGCCYYLMFSFATTKTDMFLVPLVGAFGALPIGIARAFNSKIVSGDELGAMYASIAWAELLSTIVASVSFNAIYRATLAWMPTFVFLLMLGAYFIGLLLSIFLTVKMKREGPRGYTRIPGTQTA